MAFCTVVTEVGMAAKSLVNAFIIHVIGAPIIFALISLLYFKKFYDPHHYRRLSS